MEEIKKYQIALSDYDYQRDIQNRLLMAQLTPFDIEVIREIVDGSLQTSVKQIAEQLGVDGKKVKQTLKKLADSGLVRVEKEELFIDKEMRRYYETQLPKFGEEFVPDMEFLQGLLNKVPIHALPEWYALPRTTENIFEAIIESIFQSPRKYERHLTTVKFEESVLHEIKKEVFEAPDFQVSAQDLIEKFSLTRTEFEEHMLNLEYHLICCLGYKEVEGQWQEIVTPFHEWRAYLCALRDRAALSIAEPAKIQRLHSEEFGFILDLATLIRAGQQEELVLSSNQKDGLEWIKEHLPHVCQWPYIEEYSAALLQILEEGFSVEWLDKPLLDKAAELYRFRAHQLLDPAAEGIYKLRDLHEVERSLRGITERGWIYLDDFIAGLSVALGPAAAITLQNRGKRWSYVFPDYSKEEKLFIEKALLGPLFEIGMIAQGVHQEKRCICLTAFGRSRLEG